MTAALNYLSRMTEQFFESRMQRAACRITTATRRLNVADRNRPR